MHFSKTNNRIKLSGILVLFLLLMTFFSCSKNTDAIIPVADKAAGFETVTTANRSSGITSLVPMNRIYYVSCANGGNGEDVELTGNLNVVQKLIVNDNRFTYTYHINPQGLTGLGLTSGEKFVASGGSNGTQSGLLENQQFTTTVTEQLRIVGASTTFLVRYKFHVTVTPDGVYTSSISEEQSDCGTH